MIERLLESSAIAEENNEEPDESADDMKLTSLTSISDFLTVQEARSLRISAYGQDAILLLPVQVR